MRRLALFALVVLLLAFVGMGLLVQSARRSMDSTLGISAPKNVTIERGATLNSVVRTLAADGLLARPRLAYWHARLTQHTLVRAGEYVALPEDTPRSLLDKIAQGHVKTEHFVVIEGQNRWQVRQALADERWMTPAQFDKLCDDEAFLRKQAVPGPSCEGYLFPETYTLARGLSPEAIFAAMFELFHKNYAALSADGTGPLGFDMRGLATFASIIEKETGAHSEREHVACVFYNRLRAKPAWRLDTDPSVIYAATLADPSFDGNLTRAHLRELDSPYNTYRVAGLPPGPIANAGAAAFRAAAHPASCADFFFVSNNAGEHIFCPTLACHNKAVQKWQVEYFKKGRGH